MHIKNKCCKNVALFLTSRKRVRRRCIMWIELNWMFFSYIQIYVFSERPVISARMQNWKFIWIPLTLIWNGKHGMIFNDFSNSFGSQIWIEKEIYSMYVRSCVISASAYISHRWPYPYSIATIIMKLKLPWWQAKIWLLNVK